MEPTMKALSNIDYSLNREPETLDAATIRVLRMRIAQLEAKRELEDAVVYDAYMEGFRNGVTANKSTAHDYWSKSKARAYVKN
jgi:hypothetical protein